ncbi:MAG: DNA polymerase III subunit beta [Clostridiales bacterium]|nr:DNA polymerase III subunit beta [Clostridiales bacterium]
MKFNCSKSSLDSAISIVQKAVKPNTTVPILDGILIQAEGSSVKLTGYDLETGIEADVDSDISAEGSVVVNSKIFGEIIRKLPEDMVTIKTDDNFKLSIESGSTVFNIRGKSSENYPKIPVIGNNNKIILPQAMLKKMISKTIFAVSKDETRQSLTGCYIESNGRDITMVAIDGFRMALRKTYAGEEFPSMNYIIPGKALSEAAKIFDDKTEDEEVIIYSSENHLLFDIGHVRIVSRLIKGPFVAYNSIIQKNPKSVMTISKKALYDAVERAALIILNDERRCPVQLYMNESGTVLTVAANTDCGTLREDVDANLTGEKIDIDFNARYLIDALKNIDEENIKIEFNGGQGPCIITPVEGDDFVYLILPIRR